MNNWWIFNFTKVQLETSCIWLQPLLSRYYKYKYTHVQVLQVQVHSCPGTTSTRHLQRTGLAQQALARIWWASICHCHTTISGLKHSAFSSLQIVPWCLISGFRQKRSKCGKCLVNNLTIIETVYNNHNLPCKISLYCHEVCFVLTLIHQQYCVINVSIKTIFIIW